MKIEYITINDGIFKGYTAVYERKFVAVFSKSAEYKRSSLTKIHDAENFYPDDREKQLLDAYCFDFSRQLVAYILHETKKSNEEKNANLFSFRVGHELSSLPKTLILSDSMNYLIEAFDFCAINNLKGVAEENKREYSHLAKFCHEQLEKLQEKCRLAEEKEREKVEQGLFQKEEEKDGEFDLKSSKSAKKQSEKAIER